MTSRHVASIARQCAAYLGASHPQAMQEQAVDLFRQLAKIDSEAVWWSLVQLSRSAVREHRFTVVSSGADLLGPSPHQLPAESQLRAMLTPMLNANLNTANMLTSAMFGPAVRHEASSAAALDVRGSGEFAKNVRLLLAEISRAREFALESYPM